MSAEQISPGDWEKKKLNRRDFLISGGKFAAGGAVMCGLGLVATNEILKGKDGIVETREGIYTPIYEKHAIGIKPKDIPQDTDALFREGTFTLQLFQDHTKRVFELNIYDNQPYIPNDIRDNIAKRNIPIVFGDVDEGVNYINILGADASIGLLAYASSQLIKEKDGSSFSRRKLLKQTLNAVFAWGVLSYIPYLPVDLSISQENKIINRLALVPIAKVSHAHPEVTTIFLRNAIMANKLLATGDYLKNQLGRKPKIAYWVGALHSGIEDFLQAGKGVCRNVIAAYPSWYLDDIVKNAGGVDDFSSSMLVKLSSPPQDPYANVEYTKVLDNNLKQKLLAKL